MDVIIIGHDRLQMKCNITATSLPPWRGSIPALSVILMEALILKRKNHVSLLLLPLAFLPEHRISQNSFQCFLSSNANILDNKSIDGLIFFSKNQLPMYFSSVWLQPKNHILFNLSPPHEYPLQFFLIYFNLRNRSGVAWYPRHSKYTAN